MAKKTNKKEQLSEEEILNEIKALSEKAKEISGPQLGLFEGVDLGEEDLDTAFDPSVLNDTADPDKSHRLYYTMRSAMMRNLPKGQQNKKLRQYIYDEKSLFLNRGKEKNEKGIKGSDERQSYIGNFLQVAFDTVNRWISEGANPFDLYMAFHKLNEEKGYHKESVESPQTDFNSHLKGLLSVPPPKKESE